MNKMLIAALGFSITTGANAAPVIDPWDSLLNTGSDIFQYDGDRLDVDPVNERVIIWTRFLSRPEEQIKVRLNCADNSYVVVGTKFNGLERTSESKPLYVGGTESVMGKTHEMMCSSLHNIMDRFGVKGL